MRILSSRTTQEGAKILFDGHPFTGLVFDISDDGLEVTAERSVLCGEVVAIDARWGPIPRAVLQPTPTFGPAPTKLRGSLFTGVEYEFDEDGFLAGESVIENGENCGPWWGWHTSGVVASYSRNAGEGSTRWRESERWDEGGRLKSLDRRGIIASWGSGLETMRIASVHCTASIQGIPLVVGPRLYLSGEGVTDEFVTRLSGIDSLRELGVSETRLSKGGLVALVSLGLRILTTEDNELLPKQAIEGTVKLLPNCEWSHFDGSDYDDEE